MSGDLEQAVDTYARAAFQLWCLPVKVVDSLKGATTLQSTLFSLGPTQPAGARYQLTLSKQLKPGIPYAALVETLPLSAVTIEPKVLEPGNSTFRLQIEADALSHHPGATYWGEVTVTDDGARVVGLPIAVWLVVS